MRRTLFNLASIIALSLLSIVIGLWIRSVFVTDKLSWSTSNRRQFECLSSGGQLLLGMYHPGYSNLPLTWEQTSNRGRRVSFGIATPFGFAIEGGPNPPNRFLSRSTMVVLDCWLLMLILVPLPAVRLFAGARSTLRRRRGRCPACGYDLRERPTHSTCPECGSKSAAKGRPVP